MKHKKIIAIITGIILLMTGCGTVGKSSEKKAEGEQVKKEETKVSIDGFNTEGKIEETVLIDENGVKVTAKSLEYTEDQAELTLVIENNSERNYTFYSGTLGYSCNSMNGYMIDDGYFNTDVAAGKKANEVMKFDLKQLMAFGINEIADVQIGIGMNDEDYNETHFEPVQIKTPLAEKYDYKKDTYQAAMKNKVVETLYGMKLLSYSDKELYNKNGLKIVSEAVIEKSGGERAVFVEIVNDTAETLHSSFSDISLNNLVVTYSTWQTDKINPGMRKIVALDTSNMLDDSLKETFGISKIGKVACNFAVKDKEYNIVGDEEQLSFEISEKEVNLDTSGTEIYNEKEVKIIYKGVVEDSGELSDDTHLVLAVENNSGDSISVGNVYKSLSVNGYMINALCSPVKVPGGGKGFFDIALDEYDIEEAGLEGIDEVKEAEITLEIKDANEEKIDEVTVTMK